MIWTTTALTKTNAALITAAGSSQRFGEKKEYLAFGDNHSATVLSECLYTFISTGLFGQYIITVPHGDVEKAKASLFTDERLKTLAGSLENAVHLVEGGTSRQESVYRGLLQLPADSVSAVAVHDGARPWVSKELIAAVLTATETYGAAVPAIPVTDTQKEIDDTGKIIRHLVRDRIVAVQTPQGFRFDELLYAHRCAEHDGRCYTDDSEIYAAYCGPVYICAGSRENKKITYRSDLPV